MNAGVLIFAVLFCIAGYQEARRAGNKYGRTPFGWPPFVWAIVFLLSWLIGLILIAIAERILRRNPQPFQNSYTQVVPVPPGAYGYAPQGYGPPAQSGLAAQYGPPAQYAPPAQYGPPAQYAPPMPQGYSQPVQPAPYFAPAPYAPPAPYLPPAPPAAS